jgi:CdiI immunity protein
MPPGGGRGRRAEDGYPALARFLDGYLHQDFRVEYGSAPGAARAYAAVAKPVERARTAKELSRFIESAEGEQPDDWRAMLARIGGAWRPQSLRAVQELQAILAGGSDGHTRR